MTKGPWKFNRGNDGMIAFRIAGEGFILADVFFKTPGGHNYAVPMEEAMSNAHLISAAPELLEACKNTLKHLEDGTLVRDITKDGNAKWAMHMIRLVQDLAKLHSAVAKAEGAACVL